MGAARRHRWLSAVLLAPLAVLAVSASSFSALRCTMSGLLVPQTCCPAVADAAAGAELPEQPALQEPGCCERVVVANAKAPAVSPDGAGQLPAGPAAIVIARLPPPVVAAQRARRDARLPSSGRSAPVFLLTHAFLI